MHHRNKIRLTFFSLAAFALAVFLRFYRLGSWGLAEDENYVLHFTNAGWFSQDAKFPLLLDIVITDFSKLLFGDSLLGARLLACLIGIASIALMYHVAKHHLLPATDGSKRHKVAIAAAAIIALHPIHIIMSQSCRYPVLVMALTLLAVLFYFRARQTKKTREWVLWAFVVLLATLASPACLILATLPAFHKSLFIWLKDQLRRPVVLLILLLALAPIVFYAYIVLSWWAAIGTQAYATGPARILLATFLKFEPAIFFLTVGACLIRNRLSENARQLLFFALGTLLLLSLLSAISFVNPRYMFWSLPIWIMVAATVLVTYLDENNYLLIVLLVVATFAPTLARYYSNDGFGRNGYRTALHRAAEIAGKQQFIFTKEISGLEFILPKGFSAKRIQPLTLPLPWNEHPAAPENAMLVIFSDQFFGLNRQKKDFIANHCHLADRVVASSQFLLKHYDIFRCSRH